MNYYFRGGVIIEENIFELIQLKKQENEIAVLVSSNEKTEQFGLSLTKEEAKELVTCRNNSLKTYKRVEFGEGILDKLVFTFCDSQYINQDNYLEIMVQLQELFYMFKNESFDKLTDDELMTFMKEQFETVCAGDVEYLGNSCLERFASAIRSGYDGYKETGGHNEYEKFDEEQRWDKDLYYEVVKDLFWE